MENLNFEYLNDAFNYQIDFIIPDCETSFDEVKSAIFDDHRFFLIKNVHLDELFTKEFVEKFIKKDEGKIYLHSYGTKLDCEDCACLLPDGQLKLHLTKSTKQKIPINSSKQTINSLGYEKYETTVNLTDLWSEKLSKKMDVLKRALQPMCFSFYACWIDTLKSDQKRLKFEEFFGSSRVVDCLNRIDSKVFDISQETLDEFILNANLSDLNAWLNLENLIGCFQNNINLQKLMPNVSETGPKLRQLSVLRVRGFMPNNFVEKIFKNHIPSLLELCENENSRILAKIHGFHDSPVSLVKLNHSFDHRVRDNEENFLIACFDCKKDQLFTNLNALYKDFKKVYLINKNSNDL